MNDASDILKKLSWIVGIVAKILMAASIVLMAYSVIMLANVIIHPILISDGTVITADICITNIAMWLNIVAIMYYLDRLFTGIYKSGIPFTDKNVYCLSMIAIFIAVYAVVLPLIAWLTANLFANSGYIFFDLFILFIAFLVYVISLVFKYGVALQKESDETL